jgi:hypothetical protein
MKVIILDEGYYTWWRLLYLMKVIIPDEGYHTWWRLSYLMKVIIPDEGYTWWRLLYLMKVIIPDEGYHTWWRLLYLMNVIIPDEGYHTWWRLSPKRVVRTEFDIHFYYYYCVDTSADGLLDPEGIIHSVVNALELTWFIRYIYYWSLQFLPQTYVT